MGIQAVFAFDPEDEGTVGQWVAQVNSAPGSQASLLALGEPMHGGEAFTGSRNRLLREPEARQGFSAIALESSYPVPGCWKITRCVWKCRDWSPRLAARNTTGFLLCALLARRLLAHHAAMADSGPERLNRLVGLCDAMTADTLGYITGHELPRGRVLAFAHDEHAQKGAVEWQLWSPFGPLVAGRVSSGHNSHRAEPAASILARLPGACWLRPHDARLRRRARDGRRGENE